jgi:hypothetical protein
MFRPGGGAHFSRRNGGGWALALGVGAVDVYQKSNPVLAAMGRRSIVTRYDEAVGIASAPAGKKMMSPCISCPGPNAVTASTWASDS